MAKERYIDADALIKKILAIPIHVPTNYSNGAMESQIDAMIGQTVRTSLTSLVYNLVDAIEASATLDGPCFLCKQKEGGEELPVDVYGGKNTVCGK